MPSNQPKIKETYQEINSFLQEVKAQADINQKIALLQKDLENYIKEIDINNMIWAAIKENNESLEKSSPKRINWGGIILNVAVAVITALIIGLVMKGAAI
jgi:hypothetical protein